MYWSVNFRQKGHSFWTVVNWIAQSSHRATCPQGRRMVFLGAAKQIWHKFSSSLATATSALRSTPGRFWMTSCDSDYYCCCSSTPSVFWIVSWYWTEPINNCVFGWIGCATPGASFRKDLGREEVGSEIRLPFKYINKREREWCIRFFTYSLSNIREHNNSITKLQKISEWKTQSVVFHCAWV